MVKIKPNVSLLIFCLEDLSNAKSEVLTSLAIIVLGPISLFRSNNVYFIYLDVPVFDAYTCTLVIFSCLINILFIYLGAPVLGACIFKIVISLC